jgi:Right handed beta helix region
MGAGNRCSWVFSWLGIAILGFGFALSGLAQAVEPLTSTPAVTSGPNTSASADFYVAPTGNDSWPGTLSEPFKTLDHARLAVESLKAHVSGRTITVLIRNGTYYLPSTWTFTDADSGTSTTPILYANYPGETPVISGGRLLTGWTQASSGSWRLTIPLGTYFTQLWVNGARRYRPRTTPAGYLYITGEYSTTGSTTTVNELSYSTKAVNGVPATMANLGDVELIDFEAWDVPHMRIASVNTTTQRIVTTGSLQEQSFFHGFIPGHRFLLENVKEALSQPGQFYLDRPTGVLTYIPETGETLSNTQFVAPRLGHILQATSLSYVTFQGLTFAHSDWQVPKGGYYSGQGDDSTTAALSLTNSTGVVFESDTIEHTGGYGIEFQGTGIAGGASPYLAQFRDGLITDTGAGGIRVGGLAVCTGTHPHTNENVPQHIYIGDNLITGGGRVGVVGWGVLVGDAHDVLIEHNEISDFYSVGIGVGFGFGYTCNFAHDDVVQFNYIHNLGQGITSDFGAVYYLSGINTGNAILNNWVHDMDQDPVGYGGWGLYMDAGASQVLVQNNLVYRTTDASLHVNSWDAPPPSPPPTPNTFKNNILAYGAMGAMDRHNDTSFLSIVYENNVFYYDKASIQYGYWYCEGKTVCTSYFDFNNNLYFDKSLSSGEPAQPFFKTPKFPANGGQQPPITRMTFAQWQSQGEDKQSLFANPMFVNPTPGTDNYTLDSNSPAFSVGFVSFNPLLAGRLPTATLMAPVNAPAFPLLSTPITSF